MSRKLLAALCWSLVYVARALETWRVIYWNTFWLYRSPMKRWTTFEVRSPYGTVLSFDRPLGRLAVGAFDWCNDVAVWLVVLANRGLPPLDPGDGFLKRLHSDRFIERVLREPA